MDTEPDGRRGSWELSVARDDPSRTWLRSVPRPDLEPGQALLRVDRVGLTANNVTYAVLGEAAGDGTGQDGAVHDGVAWP